MTGRWVRQPGGEAGAVRLFCFAHAGGGGGFFAPWRDALLPEVELWPVTLPGREIRIREPAYTRVERLLEPLCEALVPHLDRPYAVFGHSMGAVVGYEVARRLAAGGRGPLCLFVSGRRAPHLPARHEPLHRLPEEEFLDAVSRLNGTPPDLLRQPGLLRLFLPSLRADFELNEVYQPLSGTELSCPVSAMTGDRDPEVTVEELAEWRSTTRGGFLLRVFSGDHFYLKHAPGELAAVIRADLRRLRPEPVRQREEAA